MSQVFLNVALVLVGFSVSLPLINRIPYSFLCMSAYLWGSLVWVVACCFLLLFGAYNSTTIIILIGLIILYYIFISFYQKPFPFSIKQLLFFGAILVLFSGISVLTQKLNYSIATVDSASRIFIGKSLVLDGFTLDTRVNLGSFNIYAMAIQSASILLGEQYIYSFQPLLFLSLIGIFFSLILFSHRSLQKSNGYHIALLSTLFLCSGYFVVFQAFYIHDHLFTSLFFFICVTSFWLANQTNNHAWNYFGSLAAIGLSLSRVEGPVFLFVILILALIQDQSSYRTRLLTYLPPIFVVIAWNLAIVSAASSVVHALKPERVLILVAAYLGLAFLVVFSEWNWSKKIFTHLKWLVPLGLVIIFIGFFILKPSHIWTNVASIASNMFHNGRWGMFWYFALLLAFFSILLPKIPNEDFFRTNILSFFIILIDLGGFRSSFRLGWSDSANRMLVHIVPLLVFYLTMKYAYAWQTTQEQIMAFIKKKSFLAYLAIPLFLIGVIFFFWLVKPVNYASNAKVIIGTDVFAENHELSVALQTNKDSDFAETKNAGDFTVVIDLRKEIHANIIELSVESDSTDDSAQRMLSDIGWAVSSDNSNWTVIYQPPSTNMSNVRLVHNSIFQYPVGQVKSFRYVKMTFKPGNPEERLKIKKINIWSHSPDGYFPDK
jgi:hypothetical protein